MSWLAESRVGMLWVRLRPRPVHHGSADNTPVLGRVPSHCHGLQIHCMLVFVNTCLYGSCNTKLYNFILSNSCVSELYLYTRSTSMI